MAARDDTPSMREIADLTRRLRALSATGRDADPVERAASLADKDALLTRIENANRTRAGDTTVDMQDTGDAAEPARADQDDAALARAMAGGYAMVGPSARTWSVDPITGIPVGPVSEAEHRRVRDLIAQERLDGAEPVWLPCADGGEEIVAAVVPARFDRDDLGDDLAVGDQPDEADGPSRAAPAAARVHDALTALEPAAGSEQISDGDRAAELTGWAQHDERAEPTSDDGWSW